jgi:hypothetical protein
MKIRRNEKKIEMAKAKKIFSINGIGMAAKNGEMWHEAWRKLKSIAMRSEIVSAKRRDVNSKRLPAEEENQLIEIGCLACRL